MGMDKKICYHTLFTLLLCKLSRNSFPFNGIRTLEKTTEGVSLHPPPSRIKMEEQYPKPASSNACRHRTPTGRRCRLPALDYSGLCFRHAAVRDAYSDSIDLSSAFGDKLSQFNSAVEIHDFLAQLTALLVQGRISCRRASVLAFNSQLLLRTLPAVEHEAGRDEPEIII